ncbi:MAG: YdcF family protein [Pirellulales bacterium]
MNAEHCEQQRASSSSTILPKWRYALLISFGIAVVLACLGFGLYGKLAAEKIVTALVMPVGFCWLVVSGRFIQLLAARSRAAFMPGLLWFSLMLFGTNPLPSYVTHRIESSVTPYRPDKEGPLDAVIVLGGGTTQGTWRAQVGGAGDRVVMAAELYHLGYTDRLITTGTAASGVSGTMISPTDQTIEIWTSLGVPRDAIMTSPGKTTFEELQGIRERQAEFGDKRIGLLTSALHLPRAMRLAAAAGLEVEPLAAETSFRDQPWQIIDLIPNGGNFSRWSALQHELMARLVGR